MVTRCPHAVTTNSSPPDKGKPRSLISEDAVSFRYDKAETRTTKLYLRNRTALNATDSQAKKTNGKFLGWSQDRKSFIFSTTLRCEILEFE